MVGEDQTIAAHRSLWLQWGEESPGSAGRDGP